MKNFNIIDKQGIKLNTANTYVNDNINVGLSEVDKDNLVAENIKKDVEILGVIGTHEGGGSLNIAYSLTPPADTSKIWLQCEEPQAVDIANYLNSVTSGEFVQYVKSLPYFDSTYKGNFFNWDNEYIGMMTRYDENGSSTSNYYIRKYDLNGNLVDSINIGSYETPYFRKYACKIKDDIYFLTYSSSVSNYDGILCKYNLASKTATFNIKIFSYMGNRAYTMTAIDDDNILITSSYKPGSTFNYVFKYTISTNTTQTLNGFSNYTSFMQYNSYYNGYLYGFELNGADTIAKKMNVFNNADISDIPSVNELMTELNFTDKVDNYAGQKDISCVTVEHYIYIFTSLNKIFRLNCVDETFELIKTLPFNYLNFISGININNTIYSFGYTSDTNGTTYKLMKYTHNQELEQNKAVITTDTLYNNNVQLIASDKLNLSVNFHNAYKGNADNLAEKVNAYYWDGSKWVGINCEDYTNDFEWSTIPNQTVGSDSSVTIDLSSYYTNNTESEVVFTARESGDVSYFSLVVSGTQLTISPVVSSAKTSTIYVTATVNGNTYTTSFNVTVGDLS